MAEIVGTSFLLGAGLVVGTSCVTTFSEDVEELSVQYPEEQFGEEACFFQSTTALLALGVTATSSVARKGASQLDSESEMLLAELGGEGGGGGNSSLDCVVFLRRLVGAVISSHSW